VFRVRFEIKDISLLDESFLVVDTCFTNPVGDERYLLLIMSEKLTGRPRGDRSPSGPPRSAHYILPGEEPAEFNPILMIWLN
jgi:hypothetical protein